MNMVVTVTAMRRRYDDRLSSCFSDPARCGSRHTPAVRRGRVAILLTHEGTTSQSRWSWARYCEGGLPTISVKRELNEPSDVQPTVTQASVTDIPCRSSAFARSMRRV